MDRVVPEGIAPAPVVVTDTWGSPESLTLSLSLSNQIHPAVLATKLLPLTIIPVPGAPEAGLRDRDCARTIDDGIRIGPSTNVRTITALMTCLIILLFIVLFLPLNWSKYFRKTIVFYSPN
jgi:hypothetical protein